MAELDQLTSLPTRRAFISQLESELKDGNQVGVIGLDIRDFATMNTHHTNAACDQLLIALAGRLTKAIYEGDMVARLGGDEFAVIAKSTASDADDLAVFAGEIEDAVSSLPFKVGDEEIRVSLKVGAAVVGSLSDLEDAFP